MEINSERLYDLLEKYTGNRCTKEEFNELLGIVRNKHYKEEFTQLINKLWATLPASPVAHDWSKVVRKLQQETSTEAKKTPVVMRITRWQAAAIIAIAITVCTSVWTYVKHSDNMTIQRTALQQMQQQPQKTNTHILLADGSTVILSPGSKLNYPSEFTGDTREVTLEGEAYFDIERNPGKPFIIHTGSVKTTVLGTSFSIKVAPNNIVTVTVTKGIVQVEETIKQVQLAELHENEQLVYDMNTKAATAHPVDAKAVVEWVLVDMAYSDLRFGDICKVLEKRYNVNIRFENPEMASKHITATFDGTERLENVLQILCDTQHMEYTMMGDTIYIR